MSTRGTKGLFRAGKFSQDLPGFPQMGPAVRITNTATTVETTTGFNFGDNDVLQTFLVKVTTVTATSGVLNLGLLTNFSTGFAVALPVGTTGLKTLISVSTSGNAPAEFVAASYLGPLLGAAYAGTTEGSTGVGAGGSVVPRLYALDSTTVKTLSYSYNSTTAFAAQVYPIFFTLNP